MKQSFRTFSVISSYFFYIFQYLRSILHKIQLRIIYISLVQSITTYSIEGWVCAYDVHPKKLKVIINKIIKLILKIYNYINSDII